MTKPGERAYVYAKACGVIGKSFVGKRITRLGKVNWLSELDRLVFPGGYRDLPEKELLVDVEGRIMNRAARQIIRVVNCFSRPPEFLVRLLRLYEYGDLKTAIAALAGNEPEVPAFTDLGRFAQVKFRAWPDLGAMIGGTEFEFLLGEFHGGASAKNGPVPTEPAVIRLQTMLDVHYYTKLWESLLRIPPGDRLESGRMLEEEISLRNVIWALRLRTYYEMEAGEIREYLVRVAAGGRKSLAEDAEAALELPLDVRAPWASWRRAGFLNPERPDRHWRLDPRHIQNAAAEHLYGMARRAFHRRPSTLDSTVCFIKLKQFEEDLLTSIAEGLSLGLQSRDVFEMLGVR